MLCAGAAGAAEVSRPAPISAASSGAVRLCTNVLLCWLELPLPGPGDYRAVDVSVEADGGPPEHSSVSLAGGSFDS